MFAYLIHKDLSNIFLRLRARIVRSDGSDWTETITEPDSTDRTKTKTKSTKEMQGYLISHSLFSIFKSCHVSLNGINVHSVESNLHYREWIEMTLNFNRETASNRLAGTTLYAIDNDAEVSRSASLNSKAFELFGKVGVLNVSKLLIPNVTLNLRFSLENSDFFFMEPQADKETGVRSALKITDARLYVRHVMPTVELMVSHEKILSGNTRNAIYEMKKGVVLTQNLSAGLTSLMIPNFYTGIRPALIVFGMVENEAFVGNRKKNPYDFAPHGLKHMNFLINGVPKPSHPLEFSLTETENYTSQIFTHLYQALNYHQTDKSIIITQDSFAKDHFLIPLDLTASGTALSDSNEMLQNVTIGLSGSFKNALKTTITCVLYLLVPSRFEITGSRAIVNIQ